MENDDMTNDVYAKVAAKHQAAKDKVKEKKAAHNEAVASGEKKLLVERTPEGLYTVKFDGGGMLPAELRSKFTSIDKLRRIAETRYGEGILKT